MTQLPAVQNNFNRLHYLKSGSILGGHRNHAIKRNQIKEIPRLTRVQTGVIRVELHRPFGNVQHTLTTPSPSAPD
jgi:hypothetical protein